MELLNKDDENLLENFQVNGEKSFPQFSVQWKNTIENSYKNCISNYYIGKKEEDVKTIFPFFLVRSKLFGNRLISLPFTDFGGPFGELDEKVLRNILQSLKEKSDISKVEIRLNDFMVGYEKMEKILIKNGFKKEFKKNQCILKLKEEEELWNNFNRITKKGVKKAQKSELELKDINNDEELKSFYKLYFKNMKNFGTPQHSYDFFKNLMEIMGEKFNGVKLL